MGDERDRLERVVRQDARVCMLFDVPYVPVGGRPGGAGSSRVTASGVKAEPKLRAAEPAGGAMTSVTVGDGASKAENEAKLASLLAKYEADAPHDAFVTDHHTIVFGEGDACARLMFIGEAPGAEEDKTGRPFVGRAGQLLNKMIGAMGITREDVYITNVLKTRPPNNATPTVEEAQRCAPYLYEQIRIIGPEAIVTLGLPATRLMLQSTDSMGRLRGRWSSCDLGDMSVPVLPTYHPAFLLRSYTPDNRQKVWSDLQMVMDRLGLVAPAGGTT